MLHFIQVHNEGWPLYCSKGATEAQFKLGPKEGGFKHFYPGLKQSGGVYVKLCVQVVTQFISF